MKAIWKYPLEITWSQAVLMPRGSMLLSVQEQHGQLCIWAVVDPSGEQVSRRIQVLGTGHEHEVISGIYLGSAQMMSGALVWHVFDLGEEEG